MSKKEEVQIVVSAKDLASSTLSSIGGVLAGAFSIAAVVAFGKAAVDSASEQEQAEVKLAQALGYHSQALTDQAAALQKTTKFADEQIIAAQASLAMFAKDEAQLKQLTKATLDFAAAKGLDLVSAADIVGKSFGGEISMLGRYGVAVDGAIGSVERLSSILAGLGARFGGQAESQAQIFSGTLKKVKNAADEMMESFGDVVVRNPVVIAAMKMLSGVFEDIGSWVQKNQIWLMELVQGGIASFIRGIGMAVQVVNTFQTVWYALETAANAVVFSIVAALDLMITPFAKITAGLKNAGIIQNDFLADAKSGLSDYRAFVGSVVADSAGDVADSVENFGKTWEYWNGIADTLTNVEIKAAQVKDSLVANSAEAADAAAAALERQRIYAEGFFSIMNEMELAYQSERTAIVQAEYERRDQIIADSVQKELIWNQTAAWSAQARANITNAANKAMETQLTRLVEMHKFSVGEIGKALIQSVKMELIAMAAKAAVQALYFTAMGIAASSGPWGVATFGNPGMWFSAATTMAGIAAANFAGAATVNAIGGSSGGDNSTGGAPGSPPSNPASPGSMEPPASQGSGNQVTHVSVQIHNPLSTQNWDEIMELDIIPAIDRAQQRGVTT